MRKRGSGELGSKEGMLLSSCLSSRIPNSFAFSKNAEGSKFRCAIFAASAIAPSSRDRPSSLKLGAAIAPACYFASLTNSTASAFASSRNTCGMALAPANASFR